MVRHSAFASLLSTFILAGSVLSASAAATFTMQVLPGERFDEAIAWHDVNGDGRKDLVRQSERRLEAHFLDANHRFSPAPDWSVEIAPPWDLWDFADVRPDLPGDELLALSPQGVGWLSFQRGTTSTAQMEMLIRTELPLTPDPKQARNAQLVVRLAKGSSPSLMLPTRSSIRFYRRRAEGGDWEIAEEIPASLRPRPRFEADSSEAYLIGYERGMLLSRNYPFTIAEPGRLAWREFDFRLSWASAGGWLMDWNNDGRLDWYMRATGSSGETRICLQSAEGKFDRENPIVPKWPRATSRAEKSPKERAAEKARSDSDIAWMADIAAVRLDHLADVNGDGRLDVVRISSLDNWAAPKTSVAVYLQRADATFAAEPDSSLRLGTVLPVDTPPLVDLDGDGDLDLLLLRLDLDIVSLNSQMKAFVRRGLETYLGAYLWNKGSGFAKRPAWEKTVLISSEMIRFSRDPEPLMQFDRDLTGDGRPDLALRMTRNGVGIFPMLDPKRGFVEKPAATLTLPFTVERIECGDFDGDGRNDMRVDGWDPANRERIPRAVCFNVGSAP